MNSLADAAVVVSCGKTRVKEADKMVLTLDQSENSVGNSITERERGQVKALLTGT